MAGGFGTPEKMFVEKEEREFWEAREERHRMAVNMAAIQKAMDSLDPLDPEVQDLRCALCEPFTLEEAARFVMWSFSNKPENDTMLAKAVLASQLGLYKPNDGRKWMDFWDCRRHLSRLGLTHKFREDF